MAAFTAKLDKLPSITKRDLASGATWQIPDPRLVHNITTLSKILGMVVDDWNREVETWNERIAAAGEEKFYLQARAFIELQPCYLKCLFSYVLFFVSLDKVYEKVYSQLNVLNRHEKLRLKHDKPPSKSTYIQKVERIRNFSIAHIGSERDGLANMLMAQSWSPMSLSIGKDEDWDLHKLTFGDGAITLRDHAGNILSSSDDFAIGGILELNEECVDYLTAFDDVCYDYFEAIRAKLPVSCNSTNIATMGSDPIVATD